MLDAPRNDTLGPHETGPHPRKRRRRSLRRAVQLDVNLESNIWEGSVVLSATDLSHEGLWVETPYALTEGEELVVSFELPGSERPRRVWAIAEVARVALWRRSSDRRASGMGLVFTYCSEGDRVRLRDALHGRPPPLPALAAGRTSVPPPLPRLPDEHDAACATFDSELPAVLDWLLASE